MMCSSWKISVFGIVALMLAFGLAVTDAEAQALANPSAVTVTVSSDDFTALRASQEGRIITFKVNVVATKDKDIDQEGIIEIQVPGGEGWSSPRLVTGKDERDLIDAPAGGVVISSGTLTLGGDKIFVGSHKLRVTVPDFTSDAVITWSYKTNIPVRARNSNFRIISRVHKDDGPHLAVDPPTGTDPVVYKNRAITGDDNLIDAKAIYEARGHHIVIKVGSAPDASGTFALTAPSLSKGADDYKNDDNDDTITNYNHSKKYFVPAETEYNLVFTYTAAGTMYKGSVIRFDIPQDDKIVEADDNWPLLTDGSGAGKLVVSGATLFSLERTAPARESAAAFLGDRKRDRVEKGHRVTFTYMGAKTPKVTALSDNHRFSDIDAGRGYLFSAYAISVEAANDDVSLSNPPTVAAARSPEHQVGGRKDAGVTFIVVQGQGGGSLAVDANGDNNHGTNIPASTGDSAAANLVLTFTAAGRMLQGSQVTVEVPDGWTPAPRTSGVAGSTEDGIVSVTLGEGNSGDTASIAVSTNRLITVTLDETELVADETIVITYSGVKQPATGGISTFAAKSSSYKGEGLADLAIDKIPSINVVVGNGSGSIVLMKDGQRFSRINRSSPTKKIVIPALQFVYTPAGHLPEKTQVQIQIPAGWTAPQSQNNDGTVDAGELSIAPSDKVTLALPTGTGTGPWDITATTTKVLTPSDSLTITYQKVTVPDVDPRSHVFNTRVDTDANGTVATDGTLVSPSPTVGIGQAPDGEGTMTANVTRANAGENLGDLVFTYVAAGNMAFGAQVELAIDPDWPKAIDGLDPANSAKEGATTLSGDGNADLTISDDGYTLTAELTRAVSSNASLVLVFTYKNITAPSVAGSHTFYAKSQHTSTGILTGLDESPSINVSVRAAGSVALATTAGPLPSIEPGDALGNLQFTFSAGARMEIGSEVEIVIPAGWTRASEDPADAVVIPGEVALDATDPATLEVAANAGGSYTVTATTTDVLLVNETLTFTYQEVTAPAGEGPYTFASRVSAVAGGTLLPIDDSPQVVVRTAPTTLTVTASANSFFVNESITLTVALDARAPVGGLDVALTTDPAKAGTFSMTEGGDAIYTVRIADSAESMSAMVYYTNAMVGAVTVMATSGELSDSAAVTAKSTISNLQVNGLDEPLPVKGDATITVSATSKKGGGTIKITNVKTDQPVVPTLSLDADAVDPNALEGDYLYTRKGGIPLDSGPDGLLPDGDYKIMVTIAGEDKSIVLTVLNHQEPPVLSDATATPVGGATAINEGQVALSVKVTPNASDIPITSVEADVSTLDSARDDAPVALSHAESHADGDDTYSVIFTISKDNMHGDDEVMVSFTATDEYDNVSDALTAPITLRNDYTGPVLAADMADLGMAKDGDFLTITVSSESGLTVMADASSIGGGMVTLDEGMMAANGNGGNGNGMDANGNGGNGNGMDANGNVMYSGRATVTDAADGEQTITITATDASGNSSKAMVSVMIDNTGPMLTDAMVDPAMAKNGNMVTISVSTETGATVTADASAIGGDAATALAESADTAGSYSATVAVADDATDGEHMISISAIDALDNASEPASATVTVDNTAPALSDAAITPDWALNGDTVTISVTGGESGLTVTADASAIGGDAALALPEGMDADMAGTGMYSADVTVADAAGGDQTVSINASDAIGNASEAVSATVSIHVVTSASFSPADVSTGDTVMVSAMGTAGLTASFSVSDAEGTDIVNEKALAESTDTPGSYSGSFDVVVDAHPTGTYWVSVSVGQAQMTAEGALTIDHKAQFDLMIGAKTHLIHVPLDVTHINGVEGTIRTVGDLHDALGDAVNFIISLGADDGTWNSYLGDESAGGVADPAIGDDTGLIAVMNSAASLRLAGNALGTGGKSAITLRAGNNLVGVPLDPVAGLSMISDALNYPLVSAVVVSNEAGNGFQTIARADDSGDGAIMGGVGYIVLASGAANIPNIPVVGAAWDNSGMMEDAGSMVAMNGNGASTAPSIGFQTPVLQVQGKLIDEVGMMSLKGLNVSVKNLSSGTVLGHTTATDDYSMTFVKLDSSAAKVGDVLEIKADSANPLLGVRPVQHVVTADDVIDSRIDLPDLVTYEIPAQTELLANYPNPFNPETWIPYRLAEDGNVALSIYGASGSLVRTIDVGFTPAAVYVGRSDAIYWDGRNNFGEHVSSGIYFYHLNAGDFSATRKMVIVK